MLEEESMFASAPRIEPSPELWERVQKDAKFPPRGRLLTFRRMTYALAASLLAASGALFWARLASPDPARALETALLDEVTVEWVSTLGADSVGIDETEAAMEWCASLGSGNTDEPVLPMEDLVNEIFTNPKTKGAQI